MNMIMCKCSSYSCQFCSPYGAGYISTVCFSQTRVACTGVVDTCPNNMFAFLDTAFTIRVGPGFPITFVALHLQSILTPFGLVILTG